MIEKQLSDENADRAWRGDSVPCPKCNDGSRIPRRAHDPLRCESCLTRFHVVMLHEPWIKRREMHVRYKELSSDEITLTEAMRLARND